MDLEVVGVHALLFDDDATAAFVNSSDALVDWNSLLIDRYDVRHLLSSPPPPRKRRNPPSPDPHLDHERYLDLPSPSQHDEGGHPVEAGGYNAVAFTYGSTDDTTAQKNAESGLGCPGFHPPFPVPESLLQSIPTTEKVHQIIARTAMFVSKHGGQSEIVLRVKQGDNPSFGFLMPDHHLHAYFRYLVDHQGLLQPDFDGKPFHGEKISSNEHGGGGGALSLLGSLYGSMEDEDGAAENTSAHKENASGEASDVSAPVSHDSDKQESPVTIVVKDEAASKHVLPSKEKATSLKKNSFSASKAASSGMKKEGDSSILLSSATAKLHAPLFSTSKKEPLILEPPSDLKRLVEKIVEFIMKNGKQFEAVLMEQDSEHGRFPFLLPSNQYHSYYIKVLQKAQEFKLTGKSFLNDKDGLVGHGPDKRTSRSKERDTLSPGSAGCDIPNDSDRKEKFKMVLGKSKKDGPDPPKTTQQQFGVSVDAAAAAAILQAATRGIRNPNLGFLSSTDTNGNNYGCSNEGGQGSSLGSRLSSQPDNTTQKSNPSGEREVSVPVVAKAIAKTAALEAASEADSSEAHLTKEDQLKAERLRRAKMFVTMLKSGAPTLKTELSRGLSAEPQVSGVSGSVADANLPVKEREGSSAPLDVGISNKNEVSQRKHSGDENNERRSRRKYRSRSSRHEGEGEEDEKEEDDDEKLELKHSKKKHRSRCSSLEVEDDSEEERVEEERGDRHSKKKHRLHRSSNKDDEELKDEDEWDHKYSRKKHRSHRSSREKVDEEDEEERDHRLSRKKHWSHHSSRHSRDGNSHKKKHSSSKDRESRHRRKHDISSDDERRHQSRSIKHKKGSHSEREELEEGEISPKISDQSRGSVGGGVSREASVDLSKAPSQPSETTEVSEDLRAKIRAMLMATM